jgi:hypothetical protein
MMDFALATGNAAKFRDLDATLDAFWGLKDLIASDLGSFPVYGGMLLQLRSLGGWHDGNSSYYVPMFYNRCFDGEPEWRAFRLRFARYLNDHSTAAPHPFFAFALNRASGISSREIAEQNVFVGELYNTLSHNPHLSFRDAAWLINYAKPPQTLAGAPRESNEPAVANAQFTIKRTWPPSGSAVINDEGFWPTLVNASICYDGTSLWGYAISPGSIFCIQPDTMETTAIAPPPGTSTEGDNPGRLGETPWLVVTPRYLVVLEPGKFLGRYDRQAKQWQLLQEFQLRPSWGPLLKEGKLYIPFLAKDGTSGCAKYEIDTNKMEFIASNRRRPAVSPMDSADNTFLAVRDNGPANVGVLVRGNHDKVTCWHAFNAGDGSWTRQEINRTMSYFGLQDKLEHWSVLEGPQSPSGDRLLWLMPGQQLVKHPGGVLVKLDMPKNEEERILGGELDGGVNGRFVCLHIQPGLVIFSSRGGSSRFWFVPEKELAVMKATGAHSAP